VAEAESRIATIRLVVPELALSFKSATAGAAYQLIYLIYRPVLRLPLTVFRGFLWHSIALLIRRPNDPTARTNTKAMPRE
jgi:hypothetical protein